MNNKKNNLLSLKESALHTATACLKIIFRDLNEYNSTNVMQQDILRVSG